MKVVVSLAWALAVTSFCSGQIPSNASFRPSTIARPSRTLLNFTYGGTSNFSRSGYTYGYQPGGARGWGNSNRAPLSSYRGGASYDSSRYYRSTVGIGSSFSGLDASRNLNEQWPIGSFRDPYRRSNYFDENYGRSNPRSNR